MTMAAAAAGCNAVGDKTGSSYLGTDVTQGDFACLIHQGILMMISVIPPLLIGEYCDYLFEHVALHLPWYLVLWNPKRLTSHLS